MGQPEGEFRAPARRSTDAISGEACSFPFTHFLTHSISILSNEAGGRAQRFSARVIILGRA